MYIVLYTCVYIYTYNTTNDSDYKGEGARELGDRLRRVARGDLILYYIILHSIILYYTII